VPDECGLPVDCSTGGVQRLTLSAPQYMWFGLSVAMDGPLAIIGAHGAAGVFRFNGSEWTEEAVLAAGPQNSGFGSSGVAISGNTIVVGSPSEGAAYVFGHNGTSWVQEARLVPSNPQPFAGASVAIHGNCLVIGRETEDCAAGADCGTAYVFRRVGAQWTEEAVLTRPTPAAQWYFGSSVTAHGDTVGVGDTRRGYVYRYDGANRVYEATLGTGLNVSGLIRIKGDAAIIGAYYASNFTGAAYIYKFDGAKWLLEASLTASDRQPGDEFGRSVAISGHRAIAGAWLADCDAGDECGALYVFRRTGTTWQEEQLIPGFLASGRWGWSAAMNAHTAIVGAPSEVPQSPEECPNEFGCGAAYVISLALTDVDCNCDGTADLCQLASNDCNVNGLLDECEVAGGAADCQPNGIPDECETDCDGDSVADDCQIAGGAPDCQPNGVLDECEVDCDANQIPDDCDIAQGASDCQPNGVPDGCESDCDENTAPDDCDLASGAADCNQNMLIDVCEIGGQEDCNGNQNSDLCDLYMQVSEDCNANSTPDECDISAGEPDEDGNGIPDICEQPPGVGDDICYIGNQGGGPCGTSADCPGGVCGLKSRYLTVQPLAVAPRSIRVTILDMPQFPNRVGHVWWAGPEVNVPNSPNPSLRGARLECVATPYSQIWTNGYLHLFGTAIVPGSTYEVRMCLPDGTGCSEPHAVATGKWGDVISLFGGGSQPNFADVNAAIAKFGNVASAPNTVRTDLVGPQSPSTPNTPNQATNLADISAGVAAFSGFPFPFTVPACP